MIVAGSVLALLLMGLAVDGFVNPADEEPDDTAPETGGDDDVSDQSGEGDGLTDLLFADEDASDAPDPAQSYTPLSAIEPEDADTSQQEGDEEDGADGVWSAAEQAQADAEFLEVNAVTAVESGEDVAYVDNFDPDTDTLVLEFDGTEEDAPEISVEYDAEEDAATVLANGVPVTMVDGAEEMTPDHVRIVMGGDASDLEPQVLPDADASAEMERGGDTTGPQVLPTEDDARTEEAVGPATSPTVEEADEAREARAEDLLTSPIDIEPEAPRDTGDTGPQTQVTNLAPLLPDDDVLHALLDQVSGDQDAAGGVEEMLNARAGIDDVFGAGGDDAFTGTINSEMITGSEGQDAIFGDEGDDTLIAGTGNDEMSGDTGDDDLQGEQGVDFLDGGDGQDTLDGGGDRDLLFGGDGDDVLYGGAANDFLQGGMGADMLNGGSGDDTLDGVYGDGSTDMGDADVLWGGSGNDHLIIGAGDTANGGAGADTFTTGTYVETAEVAGHVSDFNPTEDRIEVIFDPQESPDPTLEVLDFADGSGADIILDGEVILSVAGAQGLDPNMIDLRAMA